MEIRKDGDCKRKCEDKYQEPSYRKGTIQRLLLEKSISANVHNLGGDIFRGDAISKCMRACVRAIHLLCLFLVSMREEV